jgi:phospholipase C
MKVLEKSYSLVFKNMLKVMNPIKKKIIKTECIVHKFINNQGVAILKNDGHINAYDLMSSYISEVNAGAVWADQDFKSSNHFYNPHSEKGLYGSSDAQKECMYYYTKALNLYFYGDIRTSMFYLGAACHLVQDMTVPQHVNVKLLDNHRQFEQWIIRTYEEHDIFKVYEEGIYLDSVKQYINYNSKKAIETFEKYKTVENRSVRFYKITSIILVLAQKTTAGLMLKFYNDIQKIKPSITERHQRQYEKIANVSS